MYASSQFDAVADCRRSLPLWNRVMYVNMYALYAYLVYKI